MITFALIDLLNIMSIQQWEVLQRRSIKSQDFILENKQNNSCLLLGRPNQKLPEIGSAVCPL